MYLYSTICDEWMKMRKMNETGKMTGGKKERYNESIHQRTKGLRNEERKIVQE